MLNVIAGYATLHVANRFSLHDPPLRMVLIMVNYVDE